MKVKLLASLMTILLVSNVMSVFLGSDAQEFVQSDISVAMKAKKKTILLSIQNNDETPIYIIEIKAMEGEIRFIKVRDWRIFKIEPNEATIETETEEAIRHMMAINQVVPPPITSGRQLIIILKLDNPSAGISWAAYDSNYYPLAVGTEELQSPVPPTSEQQETIYDYCKGTAGCFPAKVTRIVEGNILDVTTGKKNIPVRLILVITPEEGEQLYEQAKQFTAKLCPVGSHVLIDEEDWENAAVFTYGYTVSKVFCGDKILNAELLYAELATVDALECDVSEFADESWAQEYGCSSKSE